MKKELIYVVLLLVALSSCSSIISNRESQIDNARKEAIDEINKIKDEAVDNAKNEIASFMKSMRMAEDSTSAVRMDSIQRAAEKKIKGHIESVKKEIDSSLQGTKEKAQGSFIAAIVAILFSIIAIIVVIMKQKMTNQDLSTSDIEKCIDYERLSSIIWDCVNGHLKRIDGELRKSMKDGLSASNAQMQMNAKGTLQKEDVERIILNYVNNGEFDKMLENRIKGVLQREELSNRKYVQPESIPQTSTMTMPKYELYARDSRTNVLSQIEQTYQPGKSVYRLVLDSQDSTKAFVDLCNQKDVSERILNKGDEFFEPICDVNRMSNSPKHISVLEKGLAEKREENKWKVIRKVKIVFE